MAKRVLSKSPQLDLIPTKATLEELREAAKTCKNCDLWKLGTQTVFGEGAAHSKLMLVGEQPGDQEDLAGKPFVGPAGKLLDSALQEAGIDRKKVYVTNAVKHFKWEPRGKRRIHKKPNAAEICRVQAVARCRNRRDPAQNNCLPRRHRRSGAAGQGFPRHAASRRVCEIRACALRGRHRASFFHPARAR